MRKTMRKGFQIFVQFAQNENLHNSELECRIHEKSSRGLARSSREEKSVATESSSFLFIYGAHPHKWNLKKG